MFEYDINYPSNKIEIIEINNIDNIIYRVIKIIYIYDLYNKKLFYYKLKK